MRKLFWIFAWIAMSSAVARADEVRIVSWNAAPALYEALDKRLSDFTSMANDLNPDVLVLIELAGEVELGRIVKCSRNAARLSTAAATSTPTAS